MRRALLLLCVVAGCASGGSATTPAPTPEPAAVPLDDIHRTTFAADLGVDLAAMTRRPSGLYVQDLRVGTGGFARRGGNAVVRYIGWLPSGKEVDRGEITVVLGENKVIRAWEEGLLGMRVAGVRRLVVPPHLAYGSRAVGAIPADAVLVFELQVVDVR
jgi:FKBP-type peptidyl-prolyl cis-trans isomerase